MTRQQTTTRGKPRTKKTDGDAFDEAGYRDELVKIGIDLESATMVAANVGNVLAKDFPLLARVQAEARARADQMDGRPTAPAKPHRAFKTPAQTPAAAKRRVETPIKAVYDYRYS